MRPALALLAGAATAAFGAVVLGEYQLTGLTGVIAGALFGLAVAEIMLTVGGAGLARLLTPALVAVGLFSAAGLAWAAWISAGHDWSYVPNGGWMGLAIGAVAGPWWLRGGVRRAARTTAA
ncbi:MAG TPA: hypothetical protein VFB78_05335 [Acidimicrobiales bacterium]|nr:hypothetical protein [Acidimicrobiales bacterium]